MELESCFNYYCLAFSHREGLALSTITYNDDGEIRPIFYRLSLAEMVVPYAAPEHPHPRKFAFDVYVNSYRTKC
jgi:primary-amine oxidase